MLWHAEVLQMIDGAVGVDVVHCFNVIHDFCGTSEVGAGSVNA